MADHAHWKALAVEVEDSIAAVRHWLPDDPLPPLRFAWDTLASWVKDSFGAIGRWFPAEIGRPAITLASTSASGEQGNNDSNIPTLSADGTKVAFQSTASNLVPGDLNGLGDIFVKDLNTGAITLASASAHGEQGNGWSYRPSLSADGSKVAFHSGASNLVPGDANGVDDIFVKDLTTGAITLATTSASGEQGNNESWQPQLSADGTRVAFDSQASNLVPGDANGTQDVFVKDLSTGAITLASALASGEQGNGSSFSSGSSLSADGSKVAFKSFASNLAPGAPKGGVFVKNLVTGAVTLASEEQGDRRSEGASLSADGTKVAFHSFGGHVIAFDGKAFVKDLTTGAVTPISTSANGEPGNANSYSPELSADGTKVAFYSNASNLVPGDTNEAQDVFVRDLGDRGPEAAHMARIIRASELNLDLW